MCISVLLMQIGPQQSVIVAFNRYILSNNLKNKMENVRTTVRAGNRYDPEENQQKQNMPPIVGTQIFDKTLPSELNFQQTNMPMAEMNQNIPVKQKISQAPKFEVQTPLQNQFRLLTKSITKFTLKKKQGQPVQQANEPIYKKGSIITIPIKTFPIKFYDERSQLKQNYSAIKYFWRAMIGYIKAEIYIHSGWIYLLQQESEGFVVQLAWKIQNIFKIFSDCEEDKLRLVFKQVADSEVKLIEREFQCKDLNLLASLINQAKNMDITCDK